MTCCAACHPTRSPWPQPAGTFVPRDPRIATKQRPHTRPLASAAMDPAALRASFPVLARRAYLNAGTCGPLSAAAVRAAAEALEQAADEGRAGPYFNALPEVRARLRDGYAQLLGAAPGDVALTTGTSEGIVRVLGALALGPGDEALTSTEEHPGLLGPLTAARAQRGITVRA